MPGYSNPASTQPHPSHLTSCTALQAQAVPVSAATGSAGFSWAPAPSGQAWPPPPFDNLESFEKHLKAETQGVETVLICASMICVVLQLNAQFH